MGLDYNILAKKKRIQKTSTFDNTEDVQCIDLLSKCIDYINIDDFRLIIVEKEYIARPDLISLAVYGSDKYADIICKINGISNPFELNEGMKIFCPDAAALTKMVPSNIKDNNFIENPKEDSILTNTNNQNKKTLNQKRSPMEATIFDHNYTLIDGLKGLVFY